MPEVNVSKARSGEARTMRDLTTGGTALLSMGGFGYRLRFEFGRESGQGMFPEAIKPRAHGEHPGQVDLIDVTAAVKFLLNEPGLLQYPQILRYGRPAHRHALSQLADGFGPQFEFRQDFHAVRVCQRQYFRGRKGHI